VDKALTKETFLKAEGLIAEEKALDDLCWALDSSMDEAEDDCSCVLTVNRKKLCLQIETIENLISAVSVIRRGVSKKLEEL